MYMRFLICGKFSAKLSVMLFRVTIALIITSKRASCADILVAVMPQGRSHAGSFVPLLEELVRHSNLIFIRSIMHFHLSCP